MWMDGLRAWQRYTCGVQSLRPVGPDRKKNVIPQIWWCKWILKMSVKECSINAKSKTTLKPTEKALYSEFSDCQSEKLSCRTNFLSVTFKCKYKQIQVSCTWILESLLLPWPTQGGFAVFQVRRSPVSIALLSFFFHCSATSFARGSSGLGALNNAWIDSNTVRICKAGDHLSERHTRKST